MAKEPNSGWKLTNATRTALLDRFPPLYSNIVADHVTQKLAPGEPAPLPGPVDARVIGRADDGDSLECLVVAIDGSPDRPDGSTYHITWSLGEGRRARESNVVLRERGWQRLDRPIPIKLEAAKFKW